MWRLIATISKKSLRSREITVFATLITHGLVSGHGARSISYSLVRRLCRTIWNRFPVFRRRRFAKEGIVLAPVADLVRMKLTSFRLKGKVHLIDLDSVGLITPEIDQTLPEALRVRLDQVRAEERQSTGAV